MLSAVVDKINAVDMDVDRLPCDTDVALAGNIDFVSGGA